jgi:hypothetical protein
MRRLVLVLLLVPLFTFGFVRRAARETPGGLAFSDVAPRRRLRRPSPTAPDVMPAEVWLDDEERIPRASVAPLVRRRGDELVLWTVVELWDFGREPAVILPD